MSTRAAALAGTDQQGGEAGAVDADKQAEDFVRQKARSRRETMPALLHSIKPPRLHQIGDPAARALIALMSEKSLRLGERGSADPVERSDLRSFGRHPSPRQRHRRYWQ
jgi:hypothetical protein